MLNYAEQWSPQILEAIIQGTVCSPFITSNVKWLSAKTFHFTYMSTSGYKDHSRAGGWNRGSVNQVDVPYTLYHDRDVEFMIDKLDVDETNQTATIQAISSKFIEINGNPEIDAEFFSKLYAIAYEQDTKLCTATPIGDYTTANVFTKLKAMLKTSNLRTYKSRGSLLGYISSDVMDLLERSTEFTRQIVMNTIADSGLAIQTRVTEIDGVPLFEVIDNERFYTDFDFNGAEGGFEPATLAVGINAVFASTEQVKQVPKINSIYFFAPGAHTLGDGYLYQNRAYSGTFVFPNGKNNKIDCLFMDVNGATLPVSPTV